MTFRQWLSSSTITASAGNTAIGLMGSGGIERLEQRARAHPRLNVYGDPSDCAPRR